VQFFDSVILLVSTVDFDAVTHTVGVFLPVTICFSVVAMSVQIARLEVATYGLPILSPTKE